MGVAPCQSEGTHQIVMSFLPPLVVCLLKKKLKKGGGGSRAPQDPPGYAPVKVYSLNTSLCLSHYMPHLGLQYLWFY